MRAQQTVYCGRRHRTCDGAPIAHACRILDPAFLAAERAEEFGRAVTILEAMRIVLHGGVSEDGACAGRE
jgi:uncharacterized membrane protein